MIIMTENRLPAATVDRANVSRISGSAMPRVATIIDGIRFEEGTMQSVRRCGRAAVTNLEFFRKGPGYFSGMKT